MPAPMNSIVAYEPERLRSLNRRSGSIGCSVRLWMNRKALSRTAATTKQDRVRVSVQPCSPPRVMP
ncbi:hypothetical protein SALBM135S_03719 [Streptomyces alboniger]